MYIRSESHSSHIRTFNSIARLVSSALHGGFNRQACLPVVQGMLNSSISLANDTSFFWQDNSGHSWSDYLHPIVLVDICEEICGGSGMGWYPDTATRLLTWFVPGIFLVSSINLAPIGKKRFAMVAHLFGDPIHSYWSLLTKLEDWDECYDVARSLHLNTPALESSSCFWQFLLPLHATPIDKKARNTAVIIAAIKELLPPNSNLTITSINQCSCLDIPPTMLNELAGSIISARISGNITTWFAISTYIFGIICAFVSQLGGSTGSGGPSGGRIAPAMLLSWLLPNILLNNEVGQLKREDCIRIVRRLEENARTLEGPHHQECQRNSYPLFRDWTADANDADWAMFLNSQAWSGGVYSCQLQKPMLSRKVRSWFLVAVAVTSVCVSFSIAFGVLYSFPTFFSCRNVMFIGITFVWLMGPFLTRIIMTNAFFGHELRSRWRILVCKDIVIGLSVIILLVASSCGLGNSCRCWAGFNNKIKGVVLDPGQQFTENNDYIYPILIGACLFAQYLVFKTALYIGRSGLGIMTWSSKDRRASLPPRVMSQDVESVDIADSGSEGRAMLGDDSVHELVVYSNWD
ncbi:uncharacterized protein LY89DRAFT_724737 [Mollisia scopiformis]|uniref:Uncharacterized protein n=1 Tax=Mollisia scopiformis TaxID=149040 RepID=A0A132B8G8_MOLSC|nr:uncharacterized protein LY89DRAFT_724737 [Mollisia scopiformis]KUJ08696.1 hypothetical protein LY89DRAFT_724737 [Mollisia scopiformis]